jgi:Trm5-related predicted tRNA methylase
VELKVKDLHEEAERLKLEADAVRASIEDREFSWDEAVKLLNCRAKCYEA